MASEAKLKANEKYLKEKVDTFQIRVPKGQKSIIQEYAKSLGKSLNSYVVELIASDMQSNNPNSHNFYKYYLQCK